MAGPTVWMAPFAFSGPRSAIRFVEQTGYVMPNDHAGEPLNPKLEELEDRLESAREEICDIPHVSELNTGELIRVEETLAIAAQTAK